MNVARWHALRHSACCDLRTTGCIARDMRCVCCVCCVLDGAHFMLSPNLAAPHRRNAARIHMRTIARTRMRTIARTHTCAQSHAHTHMRTIARTLACMYSHRCTRAVMHARTRAQTGIYTSFVRARSQTHASMHACTQTLARARTQNALNLRLRAHTMPTHARILR